MIVPARGPFGLVSGAPVDFLALDGNPLEDFAAIERIHLRVKAGRELDVERLPRPRGTPALR